MEEGGAERQHGFVRRLLLAAVLALALVAPSALGAATPAAAAEPVRIMPLI